MARGYVPALLLLAALWGASFLFIELALRDLEPTVVIGLRMWISTLVLLPLLLAREGRRALGQLRARWRALVFLGVLNSAVPFTLIAWGQQHVDSGVAAIANASAPIFVVLLAIRFLPSERVTGVRFAGILLGLAGIAVLSGVDPAGGWWAVAGTLAVVLAGVSYAIGSLFVQTRLGGGEGLLLAAGSMAVGAITLTPLAAAQAPSEVPGWGALAAVAALGVAGTAVGLLLYFHLIGRYGATRASLVVYLLPPAALLYGALFLDEPLRAPAAAGLVLILAGVALGSGVVSSRGRPIAVEVRS
ncbi:MAG: DMT family transporter [Gaiellaceae bacterium]